MMSEPTTGGFNELKAQFTETKNAVTARIPKAPKQVGGSWGKPAMPFALAFLIILPFLFSSSSDFINATILAFAYVVMAKYRARLTLVA